MENTKCKKWPYWVPVVLYAAGIFYLSSRPAVPPPFPFFDKIIHFFLYMGFSSFVARAVAVQRERVDRYTLWIAIIVSVVYGLTDEWHQYYVPTRSCELWDWVADMLGSVVGTFLYATYNYWALKRFLALKARMGKNP